MCKIPLNICIRDRCRPPVLCIQCFIECQAYLCLPGFYCCGNAGCNNLVALYDWLISLLCYTLPINFLLLSLYQRRLYTSLYSDSISERTCWLSVWWWILIQQWVGCCWCTVVPAAVNNWSQPSQVSLLSQCVILEKNFSRLGHARSLIVGFSLVVTNTSGIMVSEYFTFDYFLWPYQSQLSCSSPCWTTVYLTLIMAVFSDYVSTPLLQ